jgi:DNA-binding transcriptional LysR family regulator
MDFDPPLLRALVAVQATGSFTRAAQRLNLTQSAVSHQIRRLEEQVGRALLRRTTRSLVLTDDGHDFVRYAEQILATFDALSHRFSSSLISGTVRFGVPEMFMSDQLPSLLAQFSRTFPAIRLDVTVSNYLDLQTMIGKGELDLAVIISTYSKVDGATLQRTKFVWAAAETFEPPRDGSLPFVLSPAPCINRQLAADVLGANNLGWHVVYSSPSQQGIHAAVLAGLGLTIMTPEELTPKMKIVGDAFGLPSLPDADYLLIWSTGEKSEAAVEFGKLLFGLSGPPSAKKRRLNPQR